MALSKMKACIKVKRKSKGSALLEFILIIPVLLAVWAGLYKLNSLFVIKQKMAVSARYGSWINKNGLEGAGVEREMLKELSRSRLIKPEKCAFFGFSREVKPFYRDLEPVSGVRYSFEFPYFKTPLLLEEAFTLGHNSWITAPKKKRDLNILKEEARPKWQDIFFP